jgi:hypothetical protein
MRHFIYRPDLLDIQNGKLEFMVRYMSPDRHCYEGQAGNRLPHLQDPQDRGKQTRLSNYLLSALLTIVYSVTASCHLALSAFLPDDSEEATSLM